MAARPILLGAIAIMMSIAVGCTTTTDLELPEGHPVVADFDGDGRLDVATVAVYSGIVVALAKPDGGFHVVKNGLFDTGPQMGVSGDFDGDGHADILYGAWSALWGTEPRIAHGDGTGHFTVTQLALEGLSLADIVGTADVDGDGLTDAFVLVREGGPHGVQQLRVLFGERERTMRLGPETDARPGASTSDHNGAVLDANEDGVPDVVLLDDDAAVYLGNPDGTFGRMVRVGPSLEPLSAVPVAGDFDGDGHVDIFASRLWLGDGSGRFHASTPDPTPPRASRRSTVALDVDGDGRDEIVCRRYEDDDATLVLLRFDGTAFTAETWSLSDSPDLAPFGRDVVLAGSDGVRVHPLE